MSASVVLAQADWIIVAALCFISLARLSRSSGGVVIALLHDAPTTEHQMRSQRVSRWSGADIRIIGVNPTAIVDRGGYRTWKAQMSALRAHVNVVQGRTIVVGDLNTTRHRPEFRCLLEAGFADALEPAGTDRTSSFKLAAHGLLAHTRPLVRLDHALISAGLTATHSTNLPGVGTDHSPFSVTIQVQPTATRDPSRLLEAAA